jgi:hypothetical protein
MDKILFCARELSGKEVLYIGNLSDEKVFFDVKDQLPGGVFVEWFSGNVISFAETTSMVLEPWQFGVFVRQE